MRLIFQKNGGFDAIVGDDSEVFYALNFSGKPSIIWEAHPILERSTKNHDARWICPE